MFLNNNDKKNAAVAQSVEQRTENPCVGGSNPPHGKLLNLLFLTSIALFIYLFSKRDIYKGFGINEEAYITGGYLILEGKVPYRDFFDNKPPVIHIMNALGLVIFGIRDCAFKFMPYVFIYPTFVIFN